MEPDGLRGAQARAIIRQSGMRKVCSSFSPASRSKNIGIDHVHDFGSVRFKIIVI
jgi:hypothetical protein